VCTGHMGTFTAKAKKKATNSSIWAVMARGTRCQARISKLPPLWKKR